MIQNTNYGASKTYVNTKVDKLTTSGVKAYTHDGATQGEIDVSNTYTPSTLALRDSNGRLIAADPASGATDKTLVTANWVSQTGDSGPNNLIHKTGNESKSGKLTFATDRPEGVTHQYATAINDDAHVKRIIQRVAFANFRVKYLVIDSRYENYGIASVIYNNGVLELTYTAIGTGSFVPTFRIFEKDSVSYIAMDMPYHVGFTLQQLVYADIYGNNIYYSPLLDEFSTNYTEVTHT